MMEFSRLSHSNALKDLAARLRDDIPVLCSETEKRVEAEHAGALSNIDRATVRAGIEATHLRFIDVVTGSESPEGRAADHVAFGAQAARAGVSMEVLMSAYRVGAMVGWERVSLHSETLDTPASEVARLAAASLAYMDELGSNSLEGYAREAAVSQSARARRRQALLETLLGGGGPVEPAAAVAGWSLPESVVAFVPTGVSPPADEEWMVLGTDGGQTVGVVAASRLEALLASGVALAAGPAVEPTRTRFSLDAARRLAALGGDGEGGTRWEDRLADLAVTGDAHAARALADLRLAPLDRVPAARRTMLTETLAAWLTHPGSPSRMAADLHLHPQTVRYRLARLRECFADSLDDPDARFELQLALRIRALAEIPPAMRRGA